MNVKEFIQKTTSDIKVKIREEFDRNFERKAFFDQKWKETKLHNPRGSLMMRSGKLRKSINARVSGNRILFTSNMPYASLHNQGGEIIVTDKMKRFFWAMYYKSAGAIPKNKSGIPQKKQRNEKLRAEALGWKNLALMKVGKKIKIEQRQFIGDHPQIYESIQKIVNNNLNDLNKKISKIIKNQ